MTENILSKKSMVAWNTRLDKMLTADVESGVELREDLKIALRTTAVHYKNLVNQYRVLRAKEHLLSQYSTNFQKSGIALLQRIRQALAQKPSKEKADEALQTYSLDHPFGRSRDEVLHHLRLAHEATQQQREKNHRLPDDLKNELQNIYTCLEDANQEIHAVRSDIAETKMYLRLALTHIVELRERICAFIVSSAPVSSQDEILQTYGLRRNSQRAAPQQIIINRTLHSSTQRIEATTAEPITV